MKIIHSFTLASTLSKLLYTYFTSKQDHWIFCK